MTNSGPISVTIVLPGIAPNPIGGYKVAFEYANAMARSGNTVKILQAWNFNGQPQYLGLPRRLRRVKHLRAVRENARPNWFKLDSKVEVVNRFTAHTSDTAGSNVVVATAAQTARFVAEACSSNGSAGAYFIQHYETWDLPSAELQATWRLPLRKLVIAPWLADIGDSLGVSTELVPNAIDASEFPRGPAVDQRPMLVAAMLSPMPFKRADIVCDMFTQVLDGVPSARGIAFGVESRPSELDARVEYVQRPTRDELRRIYQAARIYVCASDAEGWHLPPAEAMASGAAIVSTEIGGVTAYAADSARFVPAGDTNALSRAVIEVLAAEPLNILLSDRGYAAITRYTPEMAARSFEAQLKELA